MPIFHGYGAGVLFESRLPEYLAELYARDSFPFLKLPGEIRNKIYDLVLEDCIVEISIRDQPVDESETQNLPQRSRRYHGRRQQRRSPKEPVLPLCHKVYPPVRRLPMPFGHKYKIPADLFLTCRAIYSEALTVAYSKTTFRFAGPEVINSFLSTVSPSALKVIRAIEISHTTPAEPELTADEKFKVQADWKWYKTCERIREQMPEMKQLKVDLTLQDWPIKLRFNETWAKAIVCLRGKGLERCDATLSHKAFEKENLVAAARSLEIAMMTRIGRLNKIAQDKKFKEDVRKATPKRARKVLTLVFNNVPPKKPALKA